jgi:hypothetical protein
VLRFQNRIPERGHDHLLDELVGQFAAAAVAEDDCLMIENRSGTRAEYDFVMAAPYRACIRSAQMTSSSPSATWIMSHMT